MDDGLQKFDKRFEDHLVAILARLDETTAHQQWMIEQLTILVEQQRSK